VEKEMLELFMPATLSATRRSGSCDSSDNGADGDAEVVNRGVEKVRNRGECVLVYAAMQHRLNICSTGVEKQMLEVFINLKFLNSQHLKFSIDLYTDL
jgi:hypothetical protein